MTVLLVAEKPSAARNMAVALGGMAGVFHGTAYEIIALRGHLYEFAEPHEQVPADLVEKYKTWDLASLPWDPAKLAWRRRPSTASGVAEILANLKAKAATAAEVVCATDVDPSGEGGLLFAEPMLELGIIPAKLTRMYFTDEAPASIQNAFLERRAIAGGIHHFDEYKKADTRARFDYLTQQFTRVASLSAGQGAVLREGRLKSAMLLMVGEQLKAHTEWVKKPFFQNRFRDENGVLYTDPDEPTFPAPGQVPATYAPSTVVVDERTMKRVPPPRLLDLAALSSRLSGKGVKADTVLATYQRMYEDQVVSYPRTEDKTITGEQFAELLPLVDRIAAVAGVDSASLVRRDPRPTHVKDAGAHGANRPGLKVPNSMADVEARYGETGALIYGELARSFLAMFAGDYVYESQAGHLQEHPTFTGTAAVPKEAGWKHVFLEDPDDEQADDEPNTTGLGTRAESFVYEGVNKRPEHPSMKWLMKQLEKRDVGTGATRTSTYAEVTREESEKNKWPLMAETRGKVTLTTFGDMGYRLLPGTRIGDLRLTEHVYAEMRGVAAGTRIVDQVLAVVAGWVAEDIQTMKRNAETMRADLGLSVVQPRETVEGVWGGRAVRFGRVWSGHRFTDQECAALLAGEEISFTAISAKKKAAGAADPTFPVRGRLTEKKYQGALRVMFEPDYGEKDADSTAVPPDAWCGHRFTEQEKQTLLTGGAVTASDFVSQKNTTFSASVRFGREGGRMRIIPDFGSKPKGRARGRR
ncbi:type IA DNA topoisomerase (plasmid) [Leifsonia sp. ZF2019]|uniref:DNA topoisomerase n=1 Tax=Leifsonia sp. ZF2019 TaxID=2781978 RepID=UPI001CBFE0DC|nr:DNA topoisomerase [Leifsonia sp. ZF2019]UAJ81708.1 type IA DNA topoisomerase [Leifsonia sp. ZF2019]